MAAHLTDEIITTFTESMDKYSVEDFEKEVNNAAVKNDPTIFSKGEEPNLYFKGVAEEKNETAMERVLREYKMKNGGNK